MRVRKVVTVCVTCLALAGTVALPASGRTPRRARSEAVRCVDRRDVALPLTMRVEGESTTGNYALPAGRPKGLAVYAHGYEHTSLSWVEHMKAAARRGLIAVGMDYRGLKILKEREEHGYPQSRGWPTWTGAEDTIAATKLFQSACPSIETTVIFGVSMGGNVSGLAVAMAAEHKKPGGEPLFDYWVDVEGAVNVIETYIGARLLEPTGNETAVTAVEDIEAEMGGSIDQEPQAYLDHAVVNRVDDIAASSVRGVVIVHGVDDGLVPYNQAREMAALLLGARIPTDFFSVGRKSPETERETTLTGYAAGAIDENYRSPFAGHASEVSKTHIVMTTAFDRLWALFKGDAPGPYREFMVDGELGIYPEP
ncbi:MAG: alpha/beta hydrolase family protein [Actinomycetota bacterium]